jgi:hypothetical protein
MAQKTFHTPCQEHVYGAVGSMLDELVEEHFDDAAHCDYYLKYGTTLLEIAIEPYLEDNAVVKVRAYCVQGVETTPELMSELLRLNAQIPLGSFSLTDGNVFFAHGFLGRDLVPEQLVASLNSVASIADEYDEWIIERWGGATALDRLRVMTNLQQTN